MRDDLRGYSWTDGLPGRIDPDTLVLWGELTDEESNAWRSVPLAYVHRPRGLPDAEWVEVRGALRGAVRRGGLIFGQDADADWIGAGG